MQGQKGKCKDDIKSYSLDRFEQVERSKRRCGLQGDWLIGLYFKAGFSLDYRKVANSNTSCLEPCAGFYRFLIKGIFDAYANGEIFIFKSLTCIRNCNSMVVPFQWSIDKVYLDETSHYFSDGHLNRVW